MLKQSNNIMKLFRRESLHIWGILGISTIVGISLLYHQKKPKKKDQKKKYNGEKKADIGAIFGMDVGGTLCKLVYFEKFDLPPTLDDLNSQRVQLRSRKPSEDFLDELRATGKRSAVNDLETFPDSSKESLGLIKKSWSMVDLNGIHNHEALEQFYKFMANTETEINNLNREEDLVFYSPQLGGRLHFLKFETRHMDAAIDLIANSPLHQSVRELGCTGGGAHKFAAQFMERLNIQMVKYDEMDCLVRGMQFVVNGVISEFYTYCASPEEKKEMVCQRQDSFLESEASFDFTKFDNEYRHQDEEKAFNEKAMKRKMIQRQNTKKLGRKLQSEYRHKIHRPNTVLSKYPYLLVSIGTGVSILKVDGPGQYERVSGSSIGGGTFYGLSRLITNAQKYDEVLKLSQSGDTRTVDMLVGDIYGSGYDRFDLSSDTVASSFGKLVTAENPLKSGTATEADCAKGLLIMVTMNIGQIAYLNAQIAHTKRICFIGTFLRNNEVSCQRLAYAIDYWSGGKMEALFMKHEGYLGSLGAFLNSGEWGAQMNKNAHTAEKSVLGYRPIRSFSETSSYDQIFQQLPEHVRQRIKSLHEKNEVDDSQRFEKRKTQLPGDNTTEVQREEIETTQKLQFPV